MTTTAQLIDSFLFKFENKLNTCVPAYITEVVIKGDYIDNISARIVNHKQYRSGEVFKRAEISNIPVLFPSSSEGIMSFPLKVGDPVLLVFAQEDVDTFLQEGLIDEAPRTFRKFSLSDTIAIPCLHPTNSDIKAHKDNFQITFNDFTLSVKPSGDTSLTTNGKVQVNTESSSEWTTEGYTVRSNSVDIGNGSVNIVQYLSDLTDEISKITVGGTPIDNKAQFEALKSQIDQLL